MIPSATRNTKSVAAGTRRHGGTLTACFYWPQTITYSKDHLDGKGWRGNRKTSRARGPIKSPPQGGFGGRRRTRSNALVAVRRRCESSKTIYGRPPVNASAKALSRRGRRLRPTSRSRIKVHLLRTRRVTFFYFYDFPVQQETRETKKSLRACAYIRIIHV